jgi:hypothetical protein
MLENIYHSSIYTIKVVGEKFGEKCGNMGIY